MVSEKSAVVFDIYRGTTHDGPGLRTTVFLKGCPLHCQWCQNPEGIAPGPELWWNPGVCIGCGSCLKTCPANALEAVGAGIIINRVRCCFCGRCTLQCPSGAMAVTGVRRHLEELLEETTRDADYYRISGGGVTVSGGEPLLQYEFVAAFFRCLKQRGIDTALDTCGLADYQAIETVLPHTDCVLYDVKFIDPDLHRKFTGSDNRLILENLLKLRRRNIRLWIRTPLIPGATATKENLHAIARFLTQNSDLAFERWELCSFNAACATKYIRLGHHWQFADELSMKQHFIDKLKQQIISDGIPPERLVISGVIAQNKD